MADNNQTPTTEEHIPPEAAGPEIPGAAPGDVVVDIGKIDELMKKLYEGNSTGRIPDKHFDRMLAEYDKKQSGLEQEFIEKAIVHEATGNRAQKGGAA